MLSDLEHPAGVQHMILMMSIMSLSAVIAWKLLAAELCQTVQLIAVLLLFLGLLLWTCIFVCAYSGHSCLSYLYNEDAEWSVALCHSACRFEPVVQASPTLIPDGFIYLRATPNICMNRLKRRHRAEEGGVTLNYLEGLHQKHEDWLSYASHHPAITHASPDALLKAAGHLKLHAVPEPRSIQGKVDSFDMSREQLLPCYCHGSHVLASACRCLLVLYAARQQSHLRWFWCVQLQSNALVCKPCVLALQDPRP